MTLGLLMGRVRVEEKLIIKELEKRNVRFEILDDSHFTFASEARDSYAHLNVVLNRSLSHSRSLTASSVLESLGVPVINPTHVTQRCGDKIATSLTLAQHHIPQPKFAVAATPEAALEALESIGYPAVLKPAVGSWGRMIARVNDRDAAEAILEHKSMLGPHHQIIYIQEFIPKLDGDLRLFIRGLEGICGIRRRSEHWITNTARGAVVAPITLDDHLHSLCQQVAIAMTEGQGGLIALDVFETDDGYLVNEVNGTMEFRNSIEPTGVNIPGEIVEAALRFKTKESLTC